MTDETRIQGHRSQPPTSTRWIGETPFRYETPLTPQAAADQLRRLLAADERPVLLAGVVRSRQLRMTVYPAAGGGAAFYLEAANIVMQGTILADDATGITVVQGSSQMPLKAYRRAGILAALVLFATLIITLPADWGTRSLALIVAAAVASMPVLAAYTTRRKFEQLVHNLLLGA